MRTTFNLFRFRLENAVADGGAGGGGATAAAAPGVAPVVAAPAAVVAPAVAAPAAPVAGEEYKAMTPEAFKARLAAAEAAGQKAALKELGVEKVEDAKAKIAAAKAAEDAQKTELQKAQERATALEGDAAKAKAYGETIATYAKSELEALPAEAKALVIAQAGEDAHAQLKAIAALKSSGVLAKLTAPAAAAPVVASPASSKAGGTPPVPAGDGAARKRPADMTPAERKKFIDEGTAKAGQPK